MNMVDGIPLSPERELGNSLVCTPNGIARNLLYKPIEEHHKIVVVDDEKSIVTKGHLEYREWCGTWLYPGVVDDAGEWHVILTSEKVYSLQ